MKATISRSFFLALFALAPACVELEADLAIGASAEQGLGTTYLCDKEFTVWRDPGETASTSFRTQPYCGTGNIQGRTTYPGYTRLVFVQHGRSPWGFDYHDVMVDAATKAGVAGETFIIAPHVLRWNDWNNDIGGWPTDFDANRHFHWYASDWAIGETSYQNNNYLARSLFEIYDLMVAQALQRLPDVTEVIFVGQSAGAQFVQRYAAVSPLALPRGVTARYVPANPQSYLYMDGTRPYPVTDLGDIDNGNPTPPTEQNCPGYNDYHVGLAAFDALHQGYIIDVGAAQIISQYKYRNVTYLAGEYDTLDPEGGAVSCRMDVQGPNRLERAMAYADYIADFYAPLAINHRFQMVPGVGHGKGILDEDCAVRWIFNDPSFCAY